MQLRELNGQLIAHTSTIDVIKGKYMEHLQEFLISEEVSKDLQKYPNYLNPDYWYLAVSKDLSISDEKLYWEITVQGLKIQSTPLNGIVQFKEDLPVLAFSWE